MPAKISHKAAMAAASIERTIHLEGLLDGDLDRLAIVGGFTAPFVADFTGVLLQRVPSNNFTVRGSYVRELSDDAKISLTAGYSWIDSFSLGTFGTLNDIQPSYGLLDASATLNYKGYFLRVAGKNLTNEAYRTQSLPTVFFQGWAPPATFTVSVGAKF